MTTADKWATEVKPEQVTIRDTFAVAALPSAIAIVRADARRYCDQFSVDTYHDKAAREAYRIADAMMKARK